MGCFQSFHRGIKSANTFFVMLTGSNCCDFSTLTQAVIHTKTHTWLRKALKIHHFCTDRKIATVLRLTDLLKDGNQGEMRNELHTECKHNKEKCMITVYRSNYRWWRKPHGSKCLPDVRNQHATLNWVKMCVFLICVFLCVCVWNLETSSRVWPGVAQVWERRGPMTSAGETCVQFVAGNDAGTSVCLCVGTALKKTIPLSPRWLDEAKWLLRAEEHTIWKKGFEVWTQTRIKVAFPLERAERAECFDWQLK